MLVLQNVNTVDVIFPTWPLLLYVNPSLGRNVLEPLIRYEATGQWPEDFSIQDLGNCMSALRSLGNDQLQALLILSRMGTTMGTMS